MRNQKMRRDPTIICFSRQEGKNVEGRKGEVQATSTLRAWDPPPALLVVRAVVTMGNTSGLLLWPPIAALNLYRKDKFLYVKDSSGAWLSPHRSTWEGKRPFLAVRLRSVGSGLDVGWRWITVDMIFALFNSWMMVNDWRSGWR